jgi:hypothetical protein
MAWCLINYQGQIYLASLLLKISIWAAKITELIFQNNHHKIFQNLCSHLDINVLTHCLFFVAVKTSSYALYIVHVFTVKTLARMFPSVTDVPVVQLSRSTLAYMKISPSLNFSETEPPKLLIQSKTFKYLKIYVISTPYFLIARGSCLFGGWGCCRCMRGTPSSQNTP